MIPLPDVTDSTEFQKIQIPLGDLASTLSSIDIRNRNTYRKIDVKDITIFDKTQRGDYIPTKALSQAGDAQVTMDGIDVKRPTNAIDDLIPGVTVNLKAASDTPVTLSIKHDVEGIKKQVENLIGAYDGVVTQIDILTRKDDTVITDATYLSDDEKTKARANLGLFMGDISLQQLKSSMQSVMMNPYPTSLGHDLSLLAQIGISTDTRAPGSASIDKTRLRGNLEVDEPKLTAAIEQHPDAIKQLFGNDTTGDLIIDSGAAFRLDALLQPYVPDRRYLQPARDHPGQSDRGLQQGHRGLQGEARRLSDPAERAVRKGVGRPGSDESELHVAAELQQTKLGAVRKETRCA